MIQSFPMLPEFLRRMLNLDVLDETIDIVRQQSKIISFQQSEIQRLKVEYSRWGRDVIEQFLIALDHPEDQDEVRERLIAAVEDMSDEVARLEEHLV